MKYIHIFIFLFPFLLSAQDFPVKPSNYITDDANIFSDEQERLLNAKLKRFEDSTTNQIFVYISPSLNGKDLTSHSQDIFHSWKIGQGDKNNGILISIFIDDHKFRIHTGYGLEGVLPDIVTKHIQDNDMRPLFKQNQYYEGIDKGVDQLIYYSKHEFKTDNSSEESSSGLYIFFYIFSAAFLLITFLLARKINDKPTAKKVIIISSIICFIIPFIGTFILLMMIFIALSYRKDLLKTRSTSTWSSSSDSSWSSSDSSLSSSDSDSGSSFDGGGGGDSGGGGSSSDW
ncbi:MAG: TPM domain-containing protein [Bacteroidia bacterium]|nr:TPM domain-containing protein [Bacteroidia bacterium]